MHPATMSNKGHFVIGNVQLSTEPVMVTILEPLPCLADNEAAASRARYAWEPAQAREESNADLSSLERLNFLLSLNLAPEPF